MSLDIQTFQFNTETKNLLRIVINSLFSNKEIFLRELLSNSSDALDKLKSNQIISKPKEELQIFIIPNIEEKTLTIQDNGIGMTKEDIINHLGTIARSNTKRTDDSRIGFFGIGFYSSFLVAEKVFVISKHEDDEQYLWESSGDGEFTISRDISGEKILRGTKIILKMKKDQLEYLEERKLKEVIRRHSQFIKYPMHLWVTREIESDEETKEEEEEIYRIKRRKTIHEWLRLNKIDAIWKRNPKSICFEEYSTFYRAYSDDWEAPIAIKHFSVTEEATFTALLFIPRRNNSSIFEIKRKIKNISFYLRGIFVTGACKDVVPEWLEKIIVAIVAFDDLDVNISRDSVTEKKVLQTVRKHLVSKTLEMFSELAQDEIDFNKFYDQFSVNVKLGINEDSENREKLSEFLRFYSNKSGEELTSLKKYESRMNEEQMNIFYMAGENIRIVETSPLLEKLKKENYEILYLVDPIDEIMIQELKEFNGKKFVCVAKQGWKLKESNEKELEVLASEYKILCKKIEMILSIEVQCVTISDKLIHSPCALVTSEYSWSANMERIKKTENYVQFFSSRNRILEINPSHPLISGIKNMDSDSKIFKDLVLFIYETALLNSGFCLSDPSGFASRIQELLTLGFALNPDEEDSNLEVNNIYNEIPQLESDEINMMEEVD